MSGPRGAGIGRDATCSRRKRFPGRSPRGRLLGVLIGLLVPLTLPASAAAIDEFFVGGNPGGITAGPDGALWFTNEATGAVQRITTTGQLSPPIAVSTGSNLNLLPVDQITVGSDNHLYFSEPRDNQIGSIDPLNPTASLVEYGEAHGLTAGAAPEGITRGPDGRIWFTEALLGKIGRLDPTAATPITEFPSVGIAGNGPSDLTAGPDQALWFTEQLGGQIGRITVDGQSIGHFPNPPALGGPSAITQGPGGLWFTESDANTIGMITTAGGISRYPGTGAGPSAIALGRDGALWFTESEANTIGRITSGGLITNHFPVPTPASEPSDLTPGPDGALWFTERAAGKIGRIETAPVFTPPPPPPPVQVAKPKPKRRCKVPKVKGLSLKKAKKKLKKAKCKYRVRGKGFVVSTKPKAGKRTTKRVLVKAKPKRTRRARSGPAVVTAVRR